MKNAFSMIELIFVIVILGVLAAVAIPKLSATRDDAKVSTLAHSIVTASNEVVSYALSQEAVDQNITNMSNVLTKIVSTDDARLNAPNSVEFKMGSISDCVTMQTVSVGQDTNLTIMFGINGDALCDALQSMINLENYTIKLKGESIEY